MLNRGFAETMALKRSAGLETVACWQTDAQWTDREVRDQLDALFAHRVYFATASTRDARAAVELTMAEFSDTVRPGLGHLSALGHPDVRLHLPKHHAIASWTTPEGRQAPFIAQTIPLDVDRSASPCTPRASSSVAGVIATICASRTGISATVGLRPARPTVGRWVRLRRQPERAFRGRPAA